MVRYCRIFAVLLRETGIERFIKGATFIQLFVGRWSNMIRIFLGNPGSGKTLSCVADMLKNNKGIVTYSNILTNKIPNNIPFTREMLIKEEYNEKGKLLKQSLNVEFWQEAIKKHKAINIIIDEAHTVFNARRSMSKNNIIMTDFLALIRRMIGSKSTKHGTLTLISQLHNRLDNISRDMATQVRYHLYNSCKRCLKCNLHWFETNLSQEELFICPRCNSKRIDEYNNYIDVWCFTCMDDYLKWKEFGVRTFYDFYRMTDPTKYFKYYDTLQLDNLISHY